MEKIAGWRKTHYRSGLGELVDGGMGGAGGGGSGRQCTREPRGGSTSLCVAVECLKGSADPLDLVHLTYSLNKHKLVEAVYYYQWLTIVWLLCSNHTKR